MPGQQLVDQTIDALQLSRAANEPQGSRFSVHECQSGCQHILIGVQREFVVLKTGNVDGVIRGDGLARLPDTRPVAEMRRDLTAVLSDDQVHEQAGDTAVDHELFAVDRFSSIAGHLDKP